MAVAYASAGFGTNSPDITSVSFAYNNTGNALCVVVASYWYYSGVPPTVSATYAGQSLIKDFTVSDTNYNFIDWDGFHKLNAASGANTLTITASSVQDQINVSVISVSGSSTTALTGYNAIAAEAYADDAFHTTPALAITSQANDLVIGFADFNGGEGATQSLNGGTIRTTPAGTPSTPFFSNSYAGASPSVSFTQTYYGSANDSANGYFLGGWSFAPSIIPPTPTGGVTIVSGISDPGDVTIISGVSIKHTGTTLVDFT